MTTRVAINGFGRIGRLVLRALQEQSSTEQIEVVAINDLLPIDNLAYLLQYDSVQGTYAQPIAVVEDQLLIGENSIHVFNRAVPPSELPWREMGVDLVIECTGLFTHVDAASGHIDAGAKQVVISAPGKGVGLRTIVLGVNDNELQSSDKIISNASCTTNCLAPIVKVIQDHVGIEQGLMTTVHSYTASQNTVDGGNRKDFRSGRTAGLNIIPASTGAAKAVAEVIPAIKGKLTGMAFRVPTATVSVVDLTVQTNKSTSLTDITSAMTEASQGVMEGILGITHDPVVSSDFIHNPLSSVFDPGSSIELNDRFFKLIAWYDNEWGYANRVVDLIAKLDSMKR